MSVWMAVLSKSSVSVITSTPLFGSRWKSLVLSGGTALWMENTSLLLESRSWALICRMSFHGDVSSGMLTWNRRITKVRRSDDVNKPSPNPEKTAVTVLYQKADSAKHLHQNWEHRRHWRVSGSSAWQPDGTFPFPVFPVQVNNDRSLEVCYRRHKLKPELLKLWNFSVATQETKNNQ